MSPEEIVAAEWRRVLGTIVTEDVIQRIVFDVFQALGREGWIVTRRAEQ